MDIGTWLRDLRGERSQEEVARAAGLQRTSLTEIEGGKFLPSPSTLEKLLQVLDESTRLAEGDALLARCARERNARRGAA